MFLKSIYWVDHITKTCNRIKQKIEYTTLTWVSTIFWNSCFSCMYAYLSNPFNPSFQKCQNHLSEDTSEKSFLASNSSLICLTARMKSKLFQRFSRSPTHLLPHGPSNCHFKRITIYSATQTSTSPPSPFPVFHPSVLPPHSHLVWVKIYHLR